MKFSMVRIESENATEESDGGERENISAKLRAWERELCPLVDIEKILGSFMVHALT